ncbi:MAG: helix-turn-helix domain-containing protein, partial [Thermoleophilia bacterium]
QSNRYPSSMTISDQPRIREDESGQQAERQPETAIGIRLRALRRQRGYTLEQVASSAGLTRGFLSHLERGGTSASIGSLYRISDALGIEVAALFEPSGADLSRQNSRRPSFFGGEGVTDYVVTPPGERRVQVSETHIAPQGTPDRSLYSHQGDVSIVYVLRGDLEVRFADDTIILSPGDGLTFSPNQPHSWRNPSLSNESIVIWVMLPAQF